MSFLERLRGRGVAPRLVCEQCRWWVRNDAIPGKATGVGQVTPRGECRVQNPRSYQIDRGAHVTGQIVTRWPVTLADDFCGRAESAIRNS